jgi:GNAT superfamily N-acetyltransferase
VAPTHAAGDGVVVRDARPDERAAVRALVLSAYDAYAAVLPPAAWSGYLGQAAATPDAEVPVERIVAERRGARVGSVLLSPADAPAYGGAATAAVPEVRLLAVAPSARGRGIGAALMAACARRARRAGVSELGLHTTDFMAAARRLYDRLGYVRAPETDFAPAPGFGVKGYRLRLRPVSAVRAGG